MLQGLACVILCVQMKITPTHGAFDSPYIVTEKIPQEPEPERETNAPERYQSLLGNLFAGQSEFPWLVDIKVPFLPQLDAVGNLLTPFHVLTTCRTTVLYEKYTPTGVGTQITRYEGPGSMRITFASTYLWEEDRISLIYDHENADKNMAGNRVVAWMLKHPDCDSGRKFESDFAILGLSRPIQLLPPFVQFAPIWHSSSSARIPDTTDWVSLTSQTICWVAAWGRKYKNVPNAMTVDHKVKIRAYAHPNLTKCIDIWNLLCPTDTFSDAQICKPNQSPSVKAPGLICMYTRAGVGAVCDTNKGAPVVCNDQVYGLVTRAVRQDDCNSVQPKPFIVENMNRIESGRPPLYGGNILSKNKQGAAPQFESDSLILYTMNLCPKKMDAIGLHALIAIPLITM